LLLSILGLLLWYMVQQNRKKYAFILGTNILILFILIGLQLIPSAKLFPFPLVIGLLLVLTLLITSYILLKQFKYNKIAVSIFFLMYLLFMISTTTQYLFFACKIY